MWLKCRSLFNFRDHDSSKYGKESEIDCQCPRQWTGLVTPRILQEVETFIAKFPMAEVLTCPEDKLSKCPTEILEEIFQYNRLEVLFWSTRRCVMLERDQSSGTSPWWGCSPWTMEWASWEVSGKWKALKPLVWEVGKAWSWWRPCQVAQAWERSAFQTVFWIWLTQEWCLWHFQPLWRWTSKIPILTNIRWVLCSPWWTQGPLSRALAISLRLLAILAWVMALSLLGLWN